MISTSGSVLVDANAWDGIDLLLNEVGQWSAVLNIWDNNGSVASSEALTINVTNNLPTISQFSYSQPNLNDRNIIVNFEANDSDGVIDSSTITLTGPSGEVQVINNAWDGMNLPLNNEGSWMLKLSVHDNDGGEALSSFLQVDIINLSPVISSFTYSTDSIEDKIYSFNYSANDPDGSIQVYELLAKDPTDNIHKVSGSSTDAKFQAFSYGRWEFSLRVVDNFSKESISSPIYLDVYNVKSFAEFDIVTISENERKYNFKSTAFDSDGYLIRGDLVVTDPSLSTATYAIGTSYIVLNLSTPGDYIVTYRVQDNDGEWGEETKVFQVINKTPTSGFEIVQISEDRYYLIVQNSNDLDGYLIQNQFELQSPSGEVTNIDSIGNFEFRFNKAGTWNISLKVQDNDLAWSESLTKTLDILNADPLSSFDVTLSEDEKSVIVTSTSTDDGDISEYHFEATHTDGEVVSNIFIESVFTVDLNTPGFWTLKLKSKDNDGAF